jgi:hypothetical protein
VHTLVTAAGRTLVVIEIMVDEDETHLVGKSLHALAHDYRLLPVAFAGRGHTSATSPRLQVGDRFTVVAELPDIERLLRRELVPAIASVVVESFPVTARDGLATLIRLTRGCTSEEADTVIATTPFTFATNITDGEAREVLEQLTREKVAARIVS